MATESAAHAQNQKMDIGWSEEVWERIHEEVHHELHRSRVLAKVLPTVYVHTKTLSVPADVVAVPSDPNTFVPGAMTIDEGLTLRVNEQWTEFAMTPAQVEHEGADEAAHKSDHPEPSHHPHPGQKPHEAHHISTGITLATRAANLLAQAEDALILQGADALLSPMFDPGSATPLAASSGSVNGVNYRGIPSDLGLLNLHLGDTTNLATTAIPVPWYQGQSVPTGTPSPSSRMYPQSQPLPRALAPILQPIFVPPLSGSAFPFAYQGNTVGAVAQAVSALQGVGQNGPYAVVLHTVPYADALTPLPTTMILPADPIKQLCTAGFHVSSGLPPWTIPSSPRGALNLYGLPLNTQSIGGTTYSVLYTGVVLSLGARPFDLIRARLHKNHDALVTLEQRDEKGNLRFRVKKRSALRIKDLSAVVPLWFLGT